MCTVAMGIAVWLLGAPPHSVEVPKLTGERANVAQQLARLHDLKLNVGVYYLAPQNWRHDLHRNVVYLQSPQPGTKVPAGSSVAAWRFELAAKGTSPVVVPDVRGKLLSEAIQALQQCGFKTMIESESADRSARVIDQYPRAGASAYGGTSACLTTSTPIASIEIERPAP